MRDKPIRLKKPRFVLKEMPYWTAVCSPLCPSLPKKHVIVFVLALLFFSGCTLSASLPSPSKLSLVPGIITEFPSLQCMRLTATTPTSDYCEPRTPESIIVGPSHHLWFTESTNSSIGRITADGAITEFHFPMFNPTAGASDIAFGPDGNLWFTDMNLIWRMTPSGSVAEFPFPGSDPLSVWVTLITAGPDGNLWFDEGSSDGSNNIGRMTPGGSITTFPFPTSANSLGGITAGPDSNLWFTAPSAVNPDTGRFDQPSRIGRITPNGTITTFLLPTSNNDPRAITPKITAGPDGNLWFTDGIGKIGRITPSGSITEFSLPKDDSFPGEITSGPDGNLWFTEEGRDNLGRITPSGSIRGFFLPILWLGGIAAGPDGNLWFTDPSRNRVGYISVSRLIKQA